MPQNAVPLSALRGKDAVTVAGDIAMHLKSKSHFNTWWQTQTEVGPPLLRPSAVAFMQELLGLACDHGAPSLSTRRNGTPGPPCCA